MDKFSQLICKQPSSNLNFNSSQSLAKPSLEETQKTTLETKQALEKLCQTRIKAFNSVKTLSFNSKGDKIVKYISNNQLSNNPTNNQKNEKIIKITEMPVDPLENIKFKHRKIPHAVNMEPIPIMHSPQRKVTAQDQRDWKIPPCISSWKNQKGLVIPLDIRLVTDGKNLKEFKANPNFSKFADVLFIAEKSARSEIEERNRIQESIQMKATLKKKEELKLAAKQARMEKAAMNLGNISNISSVNSSHSVDTMDLMAGKIRSSSLEKEKNERNELRNIRKKEIEDNRRIEMKLNNNYLGKKRKFEDRDISEKIALGQAQPSMPLVDNRLFAQTSGLDDGFKMEEENDVYDTPLFKEKVNIYKSYNNNEDNSKKIMEKSYLTGKMFDGIDLSVKETRSGPVQFEKVQKNKE